MQTFVFAINRKMQLALNHHQMTLSELSFGDGNAGASLDVNMALVSRHSLA